MRAMNAAVVAYKPVTAGIPLGNIVDLKGP
jgi:hypothetical protein